MGKTENFALRWQKLLPKRVSMTVLVIQAAAVTAGIFLLSLLLRYRSGTTPDRSAGRRLTGYHVRTDAAIDRAVCELDPAGFTELSKSDDGVGAGRKFSGEIELKLPRTAEVFSANTINKAEFLPVAVMAATPDMHPGLPASPAAVPADCAVFCNENGEELARWKVAPGSAKNATVFRIAGEGVLQYAALTVSCGNAELDQEALRRAGKLQLPGGLYSVWYPSPADGGSPEKGRK